MNILFVNYGDFTTNSLNHIGGFANTLCAAGHACVAVAGPGLGPVPGTIGERSRTLETGSTDRLGNMQAFAAAALLLMAETLEGLPAAG